MAFGSGEYTYEVIDNWAKRPPKWTFVEVADVAVDAQDNVYVFNRSEHPVMIFDKDGEFLDWWGADQFTIVGHRGPGPHGISVAPDGTIYCADIGDHTIKRFTPEGKLLQTLGTRFLNAPQNSGTPFNRPTHVAFASTGDLYISDGYGNCSVHVFSEDGQYLRSWGEPGTDAGQFNLPHSVWVDRQDRVYVCDRPNNRVQIFNLEGGFITQWTDVHRPDKLIVGNDDVVYVAELDHRVSLWSMSGELLSRWGEEGESLEAGGLVSPHGAAVDSRGTLYVGEVAESARGIDRGSRSIQQFVRAS